MMLKNISGPVNNPKGFIVTWMILVSITVGCAKSPSLKSMPGKKEEKEILEKLAGKYKDKLVLNKDGIHFFHSLECSGAIANRFLNQQTDPETGKQTGYRQIIKCRPTREIHTIVFANIKYNKKGYKVSYDLSLKCNKTAEEYEIKIREIKYDYSAEAVSYKANVNGDEVRFPLPEEENKTAGPPL